MRDLRYAFRTMLRNPGFSIAAVLVLALGIGADSAIFMVVRAVVLAPLPYAQPDRLVNLYESKVVAEGRYNVVSGPNVLDWQRDAASFAQIAYLSNASPSLWPDDGGLPETIDGAICSYNLFSTLGVQPALGRAFTAEEDKFGGQRVVVISDTLWKRRLGARPEVIGTQIRLDGEMQTIVGVMPMGFDYPRLTQIWLPVWQNVSASTRMQRSNHRFQAIARLKPGVSVQQAGVELEGIARRIYEANPGTVTGKGATVARMDERLVAQVRPMLLVLLGAVACVLLIACVNVTNLLLARALSRRREVAVRVSVGASRSQIVKQFLTESSLISMSGAALGLLLASAGTSALIKMAGYIPRMETVRVDATVLVFTAAIAILSGLAVGIVPAMSSWRSGLASAMQEGGRSATSGRSRALFGDALVAAEVALSLMLLVSAGLMLKSFSKLRTVDGGFSAERVLTILFNLPAKRYPTPAQVAGFYETLGDRTRALPGVEDAGLVSVAPLAGLWSDAIFTIEGMPPLKSGQYMDALKRSVDPEYFKTMGIALKRGRFFTKDDRLDAAGKAIVSEGLVKEYLAGQDPIGKRIRGVNKDGYEIIGVVGDTRMELATEPEPTMYIPYAEGVDRRATMVVRTAGDPNLMSLPVQKVMREIDADLPAVTVETIDELREGGTQQSRFGLSLIGLFAGLAVVLASIGLYGVLAYSVGQRTNELGIRMALGADDADITKLMLWQGVKPAAVGIVAGVLGALVATRLLQTLLYEVSPTDPLVMVVVAGLLVLITLAASLIPAWRAAKIDPAIALRAD
jgi:predicted permease